MDAVPEVGGYGYENLRRKLHVTASLNPNLPAPPQDEEKVGIRVGVLGRTRCRDTV